MPPVATGMILSRMLQKVYKKRPNKTMHLDYTENTSS